MKLFQIAGVLLAAALLLSGCKDASAPAGSAKTAAKAPVTTTAIEAEAKGFVVGSPMATRTVYVFFDPQCPHCAVLWQAAKPLKSQAKFVWIPVGFIGETSVNQGATILAAKDPIAKMEENEASVLAKTGGISAEGVTDELKQAVKKNTALLTRFGFESVPTFVALHAQTGALVTNEGSLPTAELAAKLGLQPPAQ
ncbi:thioredoxin fold domain-containing protein [Ramlibacter sp.]|uniref:thioredoxin fold domain-containing protein n=1 Tax=Ramlibacter sp. TaxID=1917967 RepID=UPI002D092D37|nr:thioredoxin fold domain-containing protein [Ramlibacter sp.]HWI83288.1 thioredoxin fold domain-containing protein [Ramlibacter sp.]